MSVNGEALPQRRLLFSADPPRILSIAGSDPSGGAGIQADLKTIASLGGYGMCALTALTAQNTQGVRDIHITPADFFRAQLKALWCDIEVDAIKIGMLANQDIVRALGEELQTLNNAQPPIVLDPVMVSTSGSLLLTHASIRDLISILLPRCTLLTPNIPEAEQLLAHSDDGKADETDDTNTPLERLLQTAKSLTRLGPRATLLKGGHQTTRRVEVNDMLARLNVSTVSPQQAGILGAEVSQGVWKGHDVTAVRTDGEPFAAILQDQPDTWADDSKVVMDVLFDSVGRRFTLFVKPYVQSINTHGTGCTLSSALAVHLSAVWSRSSSSPSPAPSSLVSAVHASIQYVQRCISHGLSGFGRGAGPLNHLCTTVTRPVLAPAGLAADRWPLCARLVAHSLPHWRAFTQHEFVKRLANYTLEREAFIYFLRQDYLFLKHYARVYASGAASFSVGNTFERIGSFAGIAAALSAEADNHVKICEVWGISRQQLEHETVESAATLAYTRFVLDVSRSGDALELLAATCPCLLGYGELGRWVAGEQRRLGGVEVLAADKTRATVGKAFQEWIDYYAGQEFQDVVRDGIVSMERYATEDPPSLIRLQSLQRIWDAAVRLEIGVWDEALNPSLRREVFGP